MSANGSVAGGVLVSTLLAACFSPSPQVGLPCAADGECPTGQECSQQVCVLIGQGRDAAVPIDAGPGDPLPGDILSSVMAGGANDDRADDVWLADDLVAVGILTGPDSLGGPELPGTALGDTFMLGADRLLAHGHSASYGSTELDMWRAVTRNAAGDIFVGGIYDSPLSVGGGTLPSPDPADRNMMLARYSSTGAHVWSTGWGGAGAEWANAIALDPQGNLWVTGRFATSTNLGGNTLSGTGNEAYLAQYDADGAHIRSFAFGGGGSDTPFGLAVDSLGNVFVGGEFAGSASIGSENIDAFDGRDAFLAKFNSVGVVQWVRTFGSFGDDRILDVEIDASGNVAFSIEFASAVDLGGGELPYVGDIDAGFARYNTAGEHLWSMATGSSMADSARLAISGNRLIVSGAYHNTMNLLGHELSSEGESDIFVAELDEQGALVWAQSVGGDGVDQPQHIAVSADTIAVAGQSEGIESLGLVSEGGRDALVFTLQR